jgi:hypothetical protein
LEINHLATLLANVLVVVTFLAILCHHSAHDPVVILHGSSSKAVAAFPEIKTFQV